MTFKEIAHARIKKALENCLEEYNIMPFLAEILTDKVIEALKELQVVSVKNE